MKIIWRKLLVICCIAVMLVTLPGVYVLADEATTDLSLVTDAMSINDADLSMNTVEDMTQAPAVAPAYDSSNANNSIDPDIEIEVADSVIIDESDENGNGKDFLDSQLFEQSTSIGDVTITVCAEEGTFPADAILVVESLPANIQEGAIDAVNEIRDETLIVAESYTFDVKVLDAIGNELQPAENQNVSISFEAADSICSNLELDIYHLSDEGEAEQLDNDGFESNSSSSCFTVEFTYAEMQYVMQGATSVDLADILEDVGLTGNVTNVECSNEELFSANFEDNGWIVTSHKAFSSEETLKVTIDGIVYEIVVTDARTSITAQEVVNYMNNMVGQNNAYIGYCLAFVTQCWVNMGFQGSSNWGTAKNFADHNTVSTSRDNIPVGANVYFYDSARPAGHIGIYVGDGYFVHAGNKSQYEKSRLSETYYSNHYTGWGWYPGVTVTSSPIPTPVEYKAPDIKNAHITNATTASYEVRFNAYDDSGIVFAQVGCWSDKWDIDKAKWYTVPFSNNYGAITIPVSDMGGYKDCWYYCNIYVVDEFGNKSEATTLKVFIDGTAPQIKNAHTTNTTTTSYEVRFNAYDDSDITFAQVGCWSDKWDIDKAKWYTVPFSNNYGAITIPISDMGGYKDCWYYCNIYTLDAFGNRSNSTTVKVYICDTNSTNHNWGDPIWKWTGNDANGYSAATATVTCKTDKSHKMTFKATVTKKASGTGKNAKMTYTATATISGKKFTTTKTVAIKMALVSSASVGKQKTIKLTPVLTPKDTPVEAYTWKSSKPAAAKVNSSGTVTGANLGQTDITATCSKYGLSAKCTVNVWFNDVMPKDVPAGITKENYQYIYWGVKNGIINGYSDGSFKPNNPVTRAQFCIMIWKLAGKPAPSSKAASFKDISGLTANGQKAIKWAQEKGLVNGFGNGIFKPNDVLTRCQIMIILWKWSGRPAYGNMAKYSDISALTLNTQKAISWGVNNRIISASGNKFTPNGNVSRADFLNILYQFNKVSYKKIPSNLDAVPKQ